MPIDRAALATLEKSLDPPTLERIDQAAARIVAAKQRGRRVVVVTGSGPHLHEGVTTLLAEWIRLGLADGITTSSAVVAHEMGGTLDRVKRCAGAPLGVPTRLLPRGGEFELTLTDESILTEIREDLSLDEDLLRRLHQAEGQIIIKAAGNLGYPMGLWLEHHSQEILRAAQTRSRTFEEIAGLGADPRTMIGIGSQRGVPILVTIPQLVGGGRVGLAIGDSISLHERAARLARMLADAEIIIESGLALTQEIHDGPFETYTGHGLWSGWQGDFTYSLQGKQLIRIDLDPALETACRLEQHGGEVQAAIAQGLPKTKLFRIPFRMEMSGFARLEGSLPIIADLGIVWPLLTMRVVDRLGLDLRFLSYPQHTEQGRAMRETIVNEVRPFSTRALQEALTTIARSP